MLFFGRIVTYPAITSVLPFRSYFRLGGDSSATHIQGFHSESPSRQNPVSTRRSTAGTSDLSASRRTPNGTTRLCDSGISGPAPEKISHSSSSQRITLVIRAPRRASRSVKATEFFGTGYPMLRSTTANRVCESDSTVARGLEHQWSNAPHQEQFGRLQYFFPDSNRRLQA